MVETYVHGAVTVHCTPDLLRPIVGVQDEHRAVVLIEGRYGFHVGMTHSDSGLVRQHSFAFRNPASPLQTCYHHRIGARINETPLAERWDLNAKAIDGARDLLEAAVETLEREQPTVLHTYLGMFMQKLARPISQ